MRMPCSCSETVTNVMHQQNIFYIRDHIMTGGYPPDSTRKTFLHMTCPFTFGFFKCLRLFQCQFPLDKVPSRYMRNFVLVLESLWHPIHQRACYQSPIWGFQLKPCMELVLQEDSSIQGTLDSYNLPEVYTGLIPHKYSLWKNHIWNSLTHIGNTSYRLGFH